MTIKTKLMEDIETAEREIEARLMQLHKEAHFNKNEMSGASATDYASDTMDNAHTTAIQTVDKKTIISEDSAFWEKVEHMISQAPEDRLGTRRHPMPIETTTIEELKEVLKLQEEYFADAVELQTCKICFCRYSKNEVTPKFLICGHTLCVGCCRKLANGFMIRCPFCRSAMLIATGNVADGLPVNRALLKIKVREADALKFLQTEGPSKFDM